MYSRTDCRASARSAISSPPDQVCKSKVSPVEGAARRGSVKPIRRIHRTGLIACVYRAAEWRHKDIDLAAHDLLQYLDKKTGLEPTQKRS